MLGLTWDQLEVVTECTGEYRALLVNMGLDIVTGLMGGKVEKGARRRKRKGKSKGPQPPAQLRPDGRPMDTADRLAAAGFSVGVKGT